MSILFEATPKFTEVYNAPKDNCGVYLINKVTKMES
jgi:hypothetical protein